MATYERPGVYINERLLPAPIAAQGNANAAGAVLAELPRGPEGATLVNSWFEFTEKYGGYNNAYPATFGIGQFFQNGGSELFVKRVLAADAANSGITVPNTSGSEDVAQITSKSRGSSGNNLRVQFSAAAQANYYNMVVTRETEAGTGSDITNDLVLERFQNVRFDDPNSSDYIQSVVNLQSDFIEVSVLENSGTPAFGVLPLVGGADGSVLNTADYQSSISGFDQITRPLVMFAPALVTSLGPNAATTVYNSMIAEAESSNNFVIADTAPGLNSSEAITYAGTLTSSSHVAVYYPNFFSPDPIGRSPQSLRLSSVSGSMAGVYLNTDKSFGPFKAPAGVRTGISGALSLERQLTSADLDALNAASTPVNALRQLPGVGVVPMGARTLLQDGTANRYVNMRRSLIFIKENLDNLTQFALFENNDARLWARLRTAISVFLNDYRSSGGLRGETEAEAFFVKIDAENNPPSKIQNGEVNIQVGVSLQYPAEFVVINLTQTTAE